MRLGSGGVPARQRGAPKRPAVLGRVAAAHSDFLRFAVEPKKERIVVHEEQQTCEVLFSGATKGKSGINHALGGAFVAWLAGIVLMVILFLLALIVLWLKF